MPPVHIARRRFFERTFVADSTASKPLSELYGEFFEAIAADTPELLRESFRLRYQVYCVENPFENPDEQSDGLESDRFDVHSRHALLRHRSTGSIVGSARLILPRLGARVGALPIFEICPEARRVLPFQSTAEFSRFAVSKQFRRRAGDHLYGEGYSASDLLNDRRRVLPHITLGLMAKALELGRAHGIDHVCAIMEPGLLRLLTRFGLHFIPVGPMVEHHGMRQPCYSPVGELLARIKRERPEVWDVITDCGRLWGRHERLVAELSPASRLTGG